MWLLDPEGPKSIMSRDVLFREEDMITDYQQKSDSIRKGVQAEQNRHSDQGIRLEVQKRRYKPFVRHSILV